MLQTLADGDLRLRPAQLPADVAHAQPWYADPDVLLNSEGPSATPYDAGRVEGMYRYLAGVGELYIIEVLEGGDTWRPVGDVTLAPHTIPIVIGDPASRGRGLGRRVIRLLMDRARELGWTTLTAKQIYTYNERSLRLFEGLGFRRCGEGVDEEGTAYVRLELVL